ncbi:MAG: tetratricopeptide repeat protein [Planctomycetes bacterium]|nr:tetratricopeptide repeat protein [Planctomycetota bacterium]
MPRIIDNSRLFQRASEAVDKGNYDYAIELFLQIVASDPDDIKTRMSLRQVEKTKFEKSGAGKGQAVAAAFAGLGNLVAAGIAVLFRNRDAAIMQYEKYLVRYPASPFVLGLLASSLSNSGREDSAIIVLEFLRQNKPDHVKTLRKLARIYAARNDITRAVQRYEMILQYRPRDIEASKQIHNLAATESIQEGWDKNETFQEKIRDREGAARLEQAQHIVRTADQAADAVERVRKDLEEKPDSPVLWAELGDFQRRRGDYTASVKAYQKAIDLDPKNQLYVQKLMDIRLMEFDARIEEATKAADQAPDNQALKDKAAAIKAQREEFWLSELKRRVQERPTDTDLRYDMGLLYFKIGKTNEATAEFQRVVRDPKHRVNATAMLGKCFAAKDLDELAIGQFEKALAESTLIEERGKDIAYNLGVLYEKVGNLAGAEDAYKRLFEVDIGFRDIAEKMEHVYKLRRQKESPSNPDET